MKHINALVVSIITATLVVLGAIAPSAIASVRDTTYDATFNHSHIERAEWVNVSETYPSLDVELYRVAFTDAVILIEVRAKNTGDRVLDFAPEQGYISVGNFRVAASPFATQATEKDRSSLILPGCERHITLVYAGDFGQQNWNPWAVNSLTVHLFREGDRGVTLAL